MAHTLDGANGQAGLAHAVTASAGHHGHSSPRGDGSDNLVLANPLGAHHGRQDLDHDTYIPDVAYTVSPARGTGDGHGNAWNSNYVPTNGVRRLTPLECERLQGFPDGWTEGLADSHRYRQMGNAVCVPVAEWLGHRLVAVDAEGAAGDHHQPTGGGPNLYKTSDRPKSERDGVLWRLCAARVRREPTRDCVLPTHLLAGHADS